jgi:hypothetical protein
MSARFTWSRLGGAATAAAVIAGCATSPPTLVGRPRPPIAVGEVRLYLEPPAGPYESIAILDASSGHAFAFGAEAKAQVVIRRLEDQAAALGANGVLLEDITADPGAATVAGGVGTRYWGARGNVDLGVSAAFTARRHGRGTAIHVDAASPPAAAPAPPPASPLRR